MKASLRTLSVSKPRQNRVTPTGQIIASNDRGRFMGNRGDLHAKDGTLRLKWRVPAWICCTLEERNGYRVPFDTPGRYYPLFFMDEAVAFAAGHRPCAQCRREAYKRFNACWKAAHDMPNKAFLPARQIDAELHQARIDQEGRQKTWASRLGDLPDGTFVTIEKGPGNPRPALLWQRLVHPWRSEGYDNAQSIALDSMVTALTPAPIVAVMRAGYVPSTALFQRQ